MRWGRQNQSKKALELTGIEQIKGFLIQGVSYLPDWYVYLIFGLFTDYGRPVRKLTSLDGRKSTPTPKFLGRAEEYFVCQIGSNFHISLIYATIGFVKLYLRLLRWQIKTPLDIKKVSKSEVPYANILGEQKYYFENEFFFIPISSTFEQNLM